MQRLMEIAGNEQETVIIIRNNCFYCVRLKDLEEYECLGSGTPPTVPAFHTGTWMVGGPTVKKFGWTHPPASP